MKIIFSGYRKYRALYEFVARNGDELSFQPGDIIMVSYNKNLYHFLFLQTLEHKVQMSQFFKLSIWFCKQVAYQVVSVVILIRIEGLENKYNWGPLLCITAYDLKNLIARWEKHHQFLLISSFAIFPILRKKSKISLKIIDWLYHNFLNFPVHEDVIEKLNWNNSLSFCHFSFRASQSHGFFIMYFILHLCYSAEGQVRRLLLMMILGYNMKTMKLKPSWWNAIKCIYLKS